MASASRVSGCVETTAVEKDGSAHDATVADRSNLFVYPNSC